MTGWLGGALRQNFGFRPQAKSFCEVDDLLIHGDCAPPKFGTFWMYLSVLDRRLPAAGIVPFVND